MPTLVSSGSENVESMPGTIPVINLSQDPATLAQEILKASLEFGLFQVINHGVAENLMDDTMNVFKEFFNMPAEDKATFYSDDRTKSCRLYTIKDFINGKVHMWRDTFLHPCHPLEEHIQSWPEKPPHYREVVGAYSVEVRKFGLKILDLICEGLGLESGYFEGELSEIQTVYANHCPTFPNPSLALGVPGHFDPNAITILQQQVYGLQILKDGQWIGVEPIPSALVVLIGYQLEIISNGKFRSPEHRVVTNSSADRTSVGTFIGPTPDCVIEPAKALLGASNPPLFRTFQYKEFLQYFRAKSGDASTSVLQHFSLQT